MDLNLQGVQKLTLPLSLLITYKLIKSHIVKQNSYLKYTNVHNFFDTKINLIGFSKLF